MQHIDDMITRLTFHDKSELSRFYIPFIKQGGLFIPTDKEYHLGDVIQVSMQFEKENATYSILGKIVWITPLGTPNVPFAGVGIQFMNEEGMLLKSQIEGYLENQHASY